jgi:HK97 family phage prohead protease
MKYKFFNTSIDKAADEEDRTITAIGSTSDIDRDKDFVDIKGMNLKNFQNNPVILWSHNASIPPIGKATKVSKTKDGLKFKIEFAGPDVNPQADTIFKLFKGGFLSAFSIGFIPNWEKASYDDKRGGFDFPEAELLELSAVNVPANQNALIQRSIEEGCIDELEAKDLDIFLKEHPAKNKRDTYTKEEVDVIVRDIIKRFETPPKVETEPEVKEELHIVDQALADLFETSDEKSTDVPEKTEQDDDLNSIFNDLE